MATLYELTEELTRLLDAIDSGEIPEEAVEDTLEGLEGEFEEKCDNIASAIKTLKAEAALIMAEEENLYARRKRKENLAEKLSDHLSEALRKVGCKKMESARNKISFRKSEAVVITDKAAFIEYAKANAPTAIDVRVTTVPVLSVIKEMVKTVELPYARLEERQHIQIK